MLPLPFRAFHRLGETPNVVVDGSPAPSTRLTLSHWPGSPTPPDLLDDLSAQIAFRALAQPARFEGIDAVSNNHFDQDGLMSVFALAQPAEAMARRTQAIDVAGAGDFATFTDRNSMRIAFAIAAFDDAERSPLPPVIFRGEYPDQCAAVYEALLPRCTDLLDHPQRYRSLWEHEDAHLTESLQAIDRGIVTLEEEPALDLAVCRVPDDWAARAATRFTVGRSAALHPAALPNRTRCMRLLVSQAGDHRVECRYETWVMYRSRPLTPRPDLRLLAARLDELEGEGSWRADAPGSLTPVLAPTAGTSLPFDRFAGEVRTFLRGAAPAWDPMTAM